MAWQETMVTMLRTLVGDLDSTTFTDQRLQQLLVVAAHYVNQEVDFDRTYSIDICSLDITPDPTSISNNASNDAYMNFVVLKAACLTDWGTFRTKALAAGIQAKCGPAELRTLEHLKGFRDLIDFGPCKAYDTLKKEHEFGNYTIKAVLSPFTSNNFDPSSLIGSRSRNGFL